MMNGITRFLPALCAVFLLAALLTVLPMKGLHDTHYMIGLVLAGLALCCAAGTVKAPPFSLPVLWLYGLWLVWGVAALCADIPFIAHISFAVFCALPLSMIAAMGASTRVLSLGGGIVLVGLSAVMLAAPDLVAAPVAAALLWPGMVMAALMTLGGTNIKSRLIAGGVAVIALSGLVRAVSLMPLPPFEVRLALWRAAGRMIADHPITGGGPGSFASLLPATRTQGAVQPDGAFAWFDPLQMAAETGLVAPILFYALVIGIMIRTIDALMLNPPHNEQAKATRRAIIVPFAGMMAVVAYAHFAFAFYTMPVLIAFGVMVGLWHRATVEAFGRGARLSIPLPARGAGALVIFAGLVWLAVPPALATDAMRRALKASDPVAYLNHLGRADRIGPVYFIDPEISLAQTNLRQMEETNLAPAVRTQYLEETQRLLDTARRWNPTWAELEVLQARLYHQSRDQDGVVGALTLALEKNPMHEIARRMLVERYMLNGNRAKAEEIAQAGLGYPHSLAYRDWVVETLNRMPE